jgi:hypothetical protein
MVARVSLVCPQMHAVGMGRRGRLLVFKPRGWRDRFWGGHRRCDTNVGKIEATLVGLPPPPFFAIQKKEE